jgi:flavodoxin
MKRIFSLIAVVAAAATTLMACGKKASATEAKNIESAPKVLVAYFSATGTTKAAAEKVAKATGAELFEIKPTEAYSSADLDWTEKTSRCCKENDDPKSRPAFEKSKESLDGYDLIFLGFPIWWNNAPRIINTFMDTYQLKGKRVVMFMTSGGSGIENVEKVFKKAYSEVKWEAGKLLNDMSEDEIGDWAKGYIE